MFQNLLNFSWLFFVLSINHPPEIYSLSFSALFCALLGGWWWWPKSLRSPRLLAPYWVWPMGCTGMRKQSRRERGQGMSSYLFSALVPLLTHLPDLSSYQITPPPGPLLGSLTEIPLLTPSSLEWWWLPNIASVWVPQHSLFVPITLPNLYTWSVQLSAFARTICSELFPAGIWLM